MNAEEIFKAQKLQALELQTADTELQRLTAQWFARACEHRYSYQFSWLGRPIIQFPQDMIAVQEIIWQIRPDLIIETGIAHGGSLIYYASLCEILNHGEVVGIDIDIRAHNKHKIEDHPMFRRITMLEGSSIEPAIVEQVYRIARGKKVLLILDSNHTHQHVFNELKLYSPLVKSDSYVIVFDTVIEDMPATFFQDRPWSVGNNPKTAIYEFLEINDRFQIDQSIPNKLLITVAPDGYLKCIRD